ncbi:hypothetical protein BJY04DRAFT_223283 [Aspergillus karnatakaensis]|uniref:asparagine synthetase B family protein n=1 Tax=Aspergillus karnatakaensis TaxID=1810916 RepID=UPI003CCE1A4F
MVAGEALKRGGGQLDELGFRGVGWEEQGAFVGWAGPRGQRDDFLAEVFVRGHPQPRERPEVEMEINESLQLVFHRGPDARGSWISDDNRVALGHIRLSIIDLTPSANQPFHSPTNNVYAVVNGELYDHERHRHDLAAEYPFQSHSDCEIVLALYQRYGLGFLDHLRGEFALVLWDADKELFLATRDRYGVKSLYYTVLEGRVLVATEMKQFLPFGWRAEWDVRAVVEGGWVFDDRTVFGGVRKVLPGEYIVSRNYGGISTVRYWDLEYPDKYAVETRTEEEMIEGVRQRLLDAVRVRLRADVPVGIYLSGGIDSSAVAGMVVHLVKEGARLGNSSSDDLSRIQCFTVQFDKDSGVDESDVAQRTADFLGVKFTPIHVTEEVLAERFEQVIWNSETFMPDIHGCGKLALAEAAHNAGFRVVLTGEGSDEHFAGYPFFQNEFLLEEDHSWGHPNTAATRPHKLDSQDTSRNHIQGLDWTLPETLPSTTKTLNNTHIAGYISRSVPLKFLPWTADPKSLPTTDAQTVFINSLLPRVRSAMESKWHPLHTAQYTWAKTAFPNALLRYLGDNLDMAHQIESRPAFLDHPLTEYVNALPPSLKLKLDPATGKFVEKHILREAVRPFVSEEIYARTKQMYAAPLRYRFDGPVHNMFRGLVTRGNVEALGFVDWGETEGLLERAVVGGDPEAFRAVVTVAQFVVVSRRFGVRTAVPGVSRLKIAESL